MEMPQKMARMEFQATVGTRLSVCEHVSRLLELISRRQLSLGPMPEDLTETLVNMTLGPLRFVFTGQTGKLIYATALAKTFLNYFNTQNPRQLFNSLQNSIERSLRMTPYTGKMYYYIARTDASR